MDQTAQGPSAPTHETRVPESTRLYRRADNLIAGRTHLFGRRAELHAQGISPVYSHRQQGCRLWDVDGNEYLDFNLGAGSVLLGHAFPSVVRAVRKQAARGTGLTVNHPLESAASTGPKPPAWRPARLPCRNTAPATSVRSSRTSAAAS